MEENISQKEKEKAEEEMIEQAFQELLNDYLATKHRKRVEIITKAFNFANQAHKGIKRRSGEPYIMHPIAVAKIVCNEIGLGSTSICSALLHDVVEDTKWTLKELEAEGFPTGVLEAVRLLTREKDVPYMAYIERLSGNQIARKVKLADLEHNSDLTRLIEVTERDLRRQEKYFFAKEFLLRQEDT